MSNNRVQDKLLQTLKVKTTCQVCNKTYTDPKTLPCLHSFCAACIEPRDVSEEADHCEIQCPECSKPAAVEEASALPNAFQISRDIAEYKFVQKIYGNADNPCEKCTSSSNSKATNFCEGCNRFVCDLCVTIHRSWSEFATHKLVRISDLKENYQKYVPDPTGSSTCPEHKKDCNLYCETCHEEICHECIIKGHRDHHYNLAQDSVQQHKDVVTEKLSSTVEIPKNLNTAIAKLDTLVQNLESMKESTTVKINATFDEVEATLSQQRKALLEEVTEVTEDKTEILQNQKLSLMCLKDKVVLCQDFIKKTLGSDHISEFFTLEQNITDRLAEVKKEFEATDLRPLEQPEVHFSFNEHTLTALLRSAHVSDGSVLHVSSASDTVSLLESVYTLNEVVTFFIAFSSSFFKMATNPSDELAAEIKYIRDGSVSAATVVLSETGFAKIQCSFKERGRYQISVTISGRHITSSPHAFFIKPPLQHFHTTVRSITKVSNPSGIAVNSKNQVIVSQESNTITMYGRVFRKVLSFGSQGEGQGQFNSPSGLAVDANDCIYISDGKNNRIQKFDPEGNYISEFTGEENTCGQLNSPSGIKVNKDGNIHVVDRGNSRIVVLSSNMEYKSTIGSGGQLSDPKDLAFDSNGCIFVTDLKQNSVYVFQETGEYRGRFGGTGTQKGRLNRPTGIAIDRFGRLFICESSNHRVSVFSTSSEFLECFSAGLSMVNPCALTVDADGFVYIASSDAIHIF